MAASIFRTALIAAALVAALPAGVMAESDDNAFFRQVSGKWTGPGKIVEGKLKGTSFKCRLDGVALDETGGGFRLDGKCRSGLFSHPITAVFVRDGDSYTGQFLDGEDGDGLSVTGGSISGRKAVIGLKRQKIEGALVTSLIGQDDLNITLLIKGGSRMVPVIGLSLKREGDPFTVGAIK